MSIPYICNNKYKTSNGTNTSPFSYDIKVEDDIPTKPATSYYN